MPLRPFSCYRDDVICIERWLVQPVDRFLAGQIREASVDAIRHLHVLVAHPPLDIFDADSLLEQQPCERMPKRVWMKVAWQPKSFQNAFHLEAGMRLSDAWEQARRRWCLSIEGRLRLLATQLEQRVAKLLAHIYDSMVPRFSLLDVVVRADRLLDVDESLIEIDELPFEGQSFPRAKTRSRQRQIERVAMRMGLLTTSERAKQLLFSNEFSGSGASSTGS